MPRNLLLTIGLFLLSACSSDDSLEKGDHPYVFHLIQASLWDKAMENNETYFPPTYVVDGFTHGTSNPDKLLNVANHFYPDVEGDWYCLKMTVDSLAATGVKTVSKALPRLATSNRISTVQMMNYFLTFMVVFIQMLSWKSIGSCAVLMAHF